MTQHNKFVPVRTVMAVMALFLLYLLALSVKGNGPVRLPRARKTVHVPARVQVEIPPFDLSVTADGHVEVPLPVGSGMPDFPDCDRDLSGCEWKAKLFRKPSKADTMIETTLEQENQVVARSQVMEIETAEYAELRVLAEAGYDKAWISHIQVARAYQANGLGRTMWYAGDAMIRTVAGSGAVRIFVDRVGWGPAIMRLIPEADVVVNAGDWFAYVIR